MTAPAETTGISRRRFLALAAGAAATGLLTSRSAAAAALGVSEDELVLVPADKRIPAEWMRTLYERGTPTTYKGAADLRYIGMPVGGGCCGQLYLGGDGRLWKWDILNGPAHSTAEARYTAPEDPSSPFRQGFALRVDGGRARSLDADGFGDVRFTGQYPIGTVEYADDSCPVEARLEAFSPFVPLAVDDSTLPVTLLTYTLRNTSRRPVDVELLGYAENPVCLRSRQQQPITLRAGAFGHAGLRGVEFAAAAAEISNPRPDVAFETWESETYDGWTVEGTAFGPGPMPVADVPDYMLRFGDLHATGARFVTSHNVRNGEDVGQADAQVGRLVSRPFTIERRYVVTRIGGGSWPDTAVRVLVDGEVVASGSGADVEPMAVHAFDVTRWEGRTAVIEIVDSERGGWGHVNVDDIVFSDRPPSPQPLSELPDAGTFALAALEPRARVRPSVAPDATVGELFDAPAAPPEVDASRTTQLGAVSVPVTVPPGRERTVRFAIGWHFPVPDRASLSFLEGSDELLRHYATRFDSAQQVVAHVAGRRGELEGRTRRWVRTFYEDSTLPHWFLERTFATASTIATSVCYRFQDGRFYGWEGTYCCAGTCQHVWNYAQALGRLLPPLERDTRERVDLGIGFQEATGEMGNRAEADRNFAADGQCGTILRCYREHLTAPDGAFLERNWPRLRRALEFMIGQDGDDDGTLEGAQPNTLDAVWYGEISWITSMYVAALRAGEAMAQTVGDGTFATRCGRLADAGERFVESELWTGEYFIQRVDPDHPEAPNYNHGCHVDQVFGQSLAWQFGLPRVLDADKTRTALAKLYRYNFAPDPASYRARNTAIPGARIYAEQGEHGMIMTTFPTGGASESRGDPPSWAAMYFNECWTGQEYQVAGHMIAEGLLEQGMLVTRAVHERYRPAKRNPYNEIECSEHYARAMAGYGVFLAACGFEYDGPRGHIGFAPRLRPEDFAAAFTAAEGWGLYRQRRARGRQESTLEVRDGSLRVASLAFAVQAPRSARVLLRHGDHGHGRALETAGVRSRDGRCEIALRDPVTVRAGEELLVVFE